MDVQPVPKAAVAVVINTSAAVRFELGISHPHSHVPTRPVRPTLAIVMVTVGLSESKIMTLWNMKLSGGATVLAPDLRSGVH